MMNISKNRLNERLAKGDETAFIEIYDLYWEPLFRYVIRIMPNEDDVADVVQDAFITFWQMKEEINKVESIKSYLFIIARNKAFKQLQVHLKEQAFFDRFVLHYGKSFTQIEQHIDSNFLSAYLDVEIAKLPEKMREIFILSRKEHLSYKEIAEKLDISDLTVKKQIHNALKRLKQNIDYEYYPYLSVLFFLEQ